MTEEMRKRLEEAAELCQQYQMIYGGNFATAYMKGYTDGYKEVIAQAKEWIRDRNRHACQEWLDKECTDFETAMNKLWEGE